MAGIRYDHLTVSQFSASENTSSGAVTGAYSAVVPYNVVNNVDFVSWRGGVVFHPVKDASVYFTYGTSFDPTSEYLTITGGQQSLPPTTNQTYEVGTKYDLFNQKLSLTGALFRVTQNNAVEAVNSTLGIYQQVGETRVQGAEVGVAGKITDAWSVFGGYTYMDGRVIASAISQTTGTYVSTPGNKLQDLPRDTIALSTTYALTSALTVGGSAYYTSDRYTSSADTGRVPGYWRFDTMASYKFNQKFSMQLNIQNILDTKNFETLSGFGAAQPGPGRTAILTAKYKF
jgi:catecholate siderophore receptor